MTTSNLTPQPTDQTMPTLKPNRRSPKALAVRSHHFANMPPNYPNTAARTVPLVIINDVLNEYFEREAQLHVDFFSIYIIKRGKGTHIIDGQSYGIARGDVYVMAPGMAHHFSGSDSLLADTLHFSASIFEASDREALADTPGYQTLFASDGSAHGQRWLHLSPDAYRMVAEQFAELKAEWSSGTPEGALMTRCLFLRLFVRLSRFFSDAAASTRATTKPMGDHEATVASALRFMDANFTRPIRVTQIAETVFLSPDRFSDVFTQAMGRTPRDYLRYLRVERARRLLVTTTMPIAEIASAVGFNDAAYLTRVLRAATGMAPRELRNAANSREQG